MWRTRSAEKSEMRLSATTFDDVYGHCLMILSPSRIQEITWSDVVMRREI